MLFHPFFDFFFFRSPAMQLKKKILKPTILEAEP